MSSELPAPLLDYFAAREQQRAAAVEEFLDGLTEYERGLFHDAAVMGYVQGLMRDRSEGCPKDSVVMALVADACFAHSDLYSTINARFEERRTTVEYFVQSQQPDGSWEQASSVTDDPENAVRWRDRKRESMPDLTFRVARRVTRVLVQAEQIEEPE